MSSKILELKKLIGVVAGGMLSVATSLVHSQVVIEFSALDENSIQVNLINTARKPVDDRCLRLVEDLYANSDGMSRTASMSYRQALNSEIHESAAYLRAARQGNGVYLHLPYFLPRDDACDAAEIQVTAKHTLWNGRWIVGSARISANDAAGRSLFFSDEQVLPVNRGMYFDPAIPIEVRERLQDSMRSILSVYRGLVNSNPLENVGVISSIVRNKGGYTGFGGDSLNIIRLSFDNPSKGDIDNLDSLFAATFAHELAHKLQSEALFLAPLGRFVVEGSADFFKVFVLLSAGVISESAAKAVVRKALDSCTSYAQTESLEALVARQAINYRAPYDCGMIYYFSAYFSGTVSDREFVQTLQKALAGATDYESNTSSKCLLYEAGCSIPRLRDLARGDKNSLMQQRDWFMNQLETRRLPSLKAD